MSNSILQDIGLNIASIFRNFATIEQNITVLKLTFQEIYIQTYLLFFSTFDLGLITLLFCIAKHQQLMLMSCLMVYNFFQESKCNNCFKEKECLGSGYIASNELKGRVYYYQGVMPHVTSICSSISDPVYMMHRYEKEQIFVKISNVVIFN